MHTGDRHVFSSRLSSFWSLSLITDTASSIGTLVNREDTSKLTIISSDLKHALLTVCMKCVEFFMFDHVLPNNGDIIMLDMNFDTLEDGDPMQ